MSTLNEALSLHKAGRLKEADQAYDILLRAMPNNPDLLYLKGIVAQQDNRAEDAKGWFEKTLKQNPNHAEAKASLQALGGVEKKVLLELGPEEKDGLAHLERHEFKEAEACFRQALAHNPQNLRAKVNLGGALTSQGQFDPALALFEEVIQAKPDMASAHENMAQCLGQMGQLEDSLEAFQNALVLKPENGDAYVGRGLAHLFLGQFKAGWADMAWRPQAKAWKASYQKFPHKIWTGEDLGGRTLLLWSDQGVGDELLALSILPDLLATGQKVVLEVRDRLVPIVARSFPNLTVVPQQIPPHPETQGAEIGAQAPLGLLGAVYRKSFADFTAHEGYLKADPELTNRFKSRYQAYGKKAIVGISWRSGNPLVGLRKSAPLLDWAPILQTPDVLFVNLQYGDVSGYVQAVEKELGCQILQDPEADPLQSMEAALAQTAAMDLVISTSNSTVHGAGALGVPVWTLLAKGPGLLWYWFLDRKDSPWYPSMRLIRQSEPGAWSPVIEEAALALNAYLNDCKD